MRTFIALVKVAQLLLLKVRRELTLDRGFSESFPPSVAVAGAGYHDMPQHIISLAMVAISRKNPDFSPVSVSCVFSFKKRRRRFDKSPFCPFSRRRQRRNQYEGLLYKIKPFVYLHEVLYSR